MKKEFLVNTDTATISVFDLAAIKHEHDDVDRPQAQSPKDIELIPRSQHQAPGPVQNSLHPNQQGGFKKLQNSAC